MATHASMVGPSDAILNDINLQIKLLIAFYDGDFKAPNFISMILQAIT